MNPTNLLQFFESHRERAASLVLVTVYATAGSTYSKAGAQMLVNEDGVFRGMLSGGCLEGDLAIRAQQVLETCQPQTVTYDLGNDDDELWGMGVGCDGLMRMYLQPLLADDDYRPFAQIAEILHGNTARTVSVATGEVFNGDLTVQVVPPPRVLILGAGLDAEPVLRFAAELGWRCTVADHRQSYLQNGEFSAAVATHCVPSDQISVALDLTAFDMAIVMSHHLVSDRNYLAQLAQTDIEYIGLLGPHKRRDRLLSELGGEAEKIVSRLHGPAGLNLGGRGPAPIALSIIAEMQKHLVANYSSAG